MANMLSKYGVPIPGGSRSPMLQPKPKFRFRVVFFGFGAAEDGEYISLETNTCGTPSVEHDIVTVDSYNSKAHYKGKYTWSTIDVSFRDAIGNMAMKALQNQLRKEFNYYSQESRTSASQYKFEMWIQALDGSNSSNLTNMFEGTEHTWVCQGCLISNSNFGDWDYSSSDAQEITMTIQPDGCVPLGPQGEALGDPITGNGTPATSSAITNSPTNINADTLADSNFYQGR